MVMSTVRSFRILDETNRSHGVIADDGRDRYLDPTHDDRSVSVGVEREAEQAGKLLRRAREARRLRLSDISEHLRIRQDYLAAIEDGCFRELPGAPYTATFLRSYAEYLKVDQSKMTDALAEFSKQTPAPNIESNNRPVRKPLAAARFFLALPLVLVVAILASWAGLSTGTDNQQNVQPVPDPGEILRANQAANHPARIDPRSAIASTTSPLEKRLALAEPGAIYGDDSATSRIVLWADDDSWIEIADPKGNIVFAKLLAPGDRYYVNDLVGQTLSTGNAGGMAIYVDGSDIPVFGSIGEVRRNIALEPQRLRAHRIQ